MSNSLDDKFDDMFQRGRKFFIREDYVRIADKMNLEYIGRDKDGSDPSAPVSVKDPCYWLCKNCGTVTRKTYRAVHKAYKQGTASCYCDRYSYSIEAYQFAGNILGFTLVGIRPRCNKTPTQWLDFYGSPLEASFVDLTNNPHNVPRKRFRGRTKPDIWLNGIPKGPSEWEEWYGVDLLPKRNNFASK